MRFVLILVLAGFAHGATRISKATGDFTAAGTWGTAEAGASAIQVTRSGSTNTTTSYVYSSAFTCTNLDVIEGVLVFGRQLTVTGTVSVALSDDNGTTATRELAVNATDLNTSDSPHFFLFGSTLTCDGGTDYKVGIKGSSAANAVFYRDGTAGNWFRVLRTNATGAPGSADLLYTTGDLTGAGTGNSFTVTMDNTAATTFGVVSVTSLGIGNRGTMTWGVAAATAYLLTIAGEISVFGGGTWNQGTSGTPIPSDSTATLSFNLTGNVDSGFRCENGGTCNFYGATKATVWTLLNTDEAAASTVIGLASTAGWAASDRLAFAPTTRTASQAEDKVILTVDSGVQVTLTAGLTNAHSGTSPTQAEVGNLTRNVKVLGETTSLQGYILVDTTGTMTARYTEFNQLGSNTANKRGVQINGTADVQFSSFWNYGVVGSQGFVGLSGSTVTFSNNVLYTIENTGFQSNAATFTANNNLFIRAGYAAGSDCVGLNSVGGTFTNNTMTGCGDDGLVLAETNGTLGTISGNTSHSHNGNGIEFSNGGLRGTLSTSTVWRNNSDGIRINAQTYQGLVIDTAVLFGNSGSNVVFATATPGAIFRSITSNGDTTFSTTYGFSSGNSAQWELYDSNFGTASGIKVTHTGADVNFDSANDACYQVNLGNVKTASGTPLGGVTTPSTFYGNTTSDMIVNCYIHVQKYNQTAGDHRTYFKYGEVRTDTTTFHNASPSQRLTPTDASNKLTSGRWLVPVASGGTVTFTAWVRKSTATDSCGANYNGNNPRLIVSRNPAAGITNNTVLDTVSVAIGNWEQLSGVTAAVTDDAVLEAYVDGDGTVGCFYVDDFGPLPTIDTSGEKYWFQGLPGAVGGGTGAGASPSSGFVAMRR
jgi:hypothetical protein